MTLDELRARATIERDGYHVFDGEYAQMSVTLEDAEFLYALVRLVKPVFVLELGTGLGVSARFMGEALAANQREGVPGAMTTVEPNPELAVRAAPLLKYLPVWQGQGPPRLPKPGLVFIDSGYNRREDDIREWTSNGYSGLICVHDSKRDYDLPSTGVYLPGVDGLWLGRAA